MNKKTFCISLALLSATFFFGQNEERKAVDAYQRAKKESLPLIEEGTKAQNATLLDSIALNFESSQQGSFEYHLVTYMNSSEKMKDAFHLQQAMALSPDDPDLVGEAIEYYGMLGDKASIIKMTDKLRKYGLYRAHESYYGDINSLMKQNEILFTNGESDTRPLLMNRSESEADYEIIRLAWIYDSLYLNELERREIICPEVFDSPSEFIRIVSELNPDRGVVLSPTLNSDLLSKFRAELIAKGLGLTIGNQLLDLTSDYEKISEGLLNSEGLTSGSIGMNYIPLLRAARLSFLQENNQEKVLETTELIKKILSSNDLEQLEEQLLK